MVASTPPVAAALGEERVEGWVCVCIRVCVCVCVAVSEYQFLFYAMGALTHSHPGQSVDPSFFLPFPLQFLTIVFPKWVDCPTTSCPPNNHARG